MAEVDKNNDGKISFEEFSAEINNVLGQQYTDLNKTIKAFGASIKQLVINQISQKNQQGWV